MKLIVAVDEKWGIGKNGDLLLSIPDDMMYYRTTTRGKVVVMGYTTLLSLPKSKPAPGRLSIRRGRRVDVPPADAVLLRRAYHQNAL